MDIKDTIDMAVQIVGSQRELARLVGESEQHISNFKKGRSCSAEKHAQIAYAAGMTTRARLILLESVIEATGADTELKNQLKVIIESLPAEKPTITSAPTMGAPARGVATDKPRLRKSLRT